MKLGLIIIAAVLIVLGIATVLLFLGPDRSPVAEDISEAVFRHQFRHNASALQQSAKAYYLAFTTVDDDPRHEPGGFENLIRRCTIAILGEERDPSPGLMRRFSGRKPPVRKVSECNADVSGVTDKRTGEAGLVFRVGRIRSLDKNSVEVLGGYFEGGMSSSVNLYRVERKNGRWRVTNDKLLVIS